MTSQVREGAPEPLFVGISRAIADDISTGRLDGRLPTEQSLCDRFGVSRMTVRKALGAVADQGLITPSWGRGWYVTDAPLSEPPNSLLSFTELARERGLEPSSRVLTARARPANADEADVLEVAPGAQIYELERLRLLDGVPAARQLSYLPLTKMPKLDPEVLSAGSVYEALEAAGVVATRADYAVEARAADAISAELLEVEPGTSLLWAMQTTYGKTGGVIEYGWSAYVGDRYRFRATLVRRARTANMRILRRHPGRREP